MRDIARSAVRRHRMGAAAAIAAALSLVGCGTSTPTIAYEAPFPTTAESAPRETFRASVLPLGGNTPVTMASMPASAPPPASPATATTEAATPAEPADPVPATVAVLPPLPAAELEARFPYGDLLDVPQLGADPVRGSGCGLAQPIAGAMSDGVWFGVMSVDATGSAIDFDVVCVYFGDAAIAMGAGVSRSGFFPVNENDRERRVPVAEGFSFRKGTTGAFACVDPGPAFGLPLTSMSRDTLGWIVVQGGRAELAVSLC